MAASTRFNGALPKGAVNDDLKTKFNSKNVLWFIEKSQNVNCVVYEANLVNGKLDEAEPVKAYWILYARDPIIEEGLNMIERNTAYGKTSKPIEGKPGHFQVTIAALKTPIEVFIDDSGTMHAQIKEGEEQVELLGVFVQMTTYFGVPKVQYVELKLRKADGSVFTKKIENK